MCRMQEAVLGHDLGGQLEIGQEGLNRSSRTGHKVENIGASRENDASLRCTK